MGTRSIENSKFANPVNKKEDRTTTTAAESFEKCSLNSSTVEFKIWSSLDKSQFSFDASANECNSCSTPDNGIFYFGSQKPKEIYIRESENRVRDETTSQGETIKERNRRLLAKDREARLHLKTKNKSKQLIKHSKQVNNLQSINEEIVINKDVAMNKGSIKRVEKNAEQKELASVDRRWEVEMAERRKQKLFKGALGIRSQSQNKVKTLKSHEKRIKFEDWNLMMTHAKIILAYSSSAFRYAMFQSNRRFKPGD